MAIGTTWQEMPPIPESLPPNWTAHFAGMGQKCGANLYMSSPLIHNGKIFTASIDEDLKGKAFIYAMDGASGKIVWKYPVASSIKIQ